MKQPIFILLCCTLALHASSQYYLRGIVHDEKGKGLYNIRILLYSKGMVPFYTGNTGAFGIPTPLAVDTITLQAEGYQTLKCAVDASKFQSLTLRMDAVEADLNKLRLISVAKDKQNIGHPAISYRDGESYSSLIENTFVDVDKLPHVGFAINVDRASYSNIRRFLNNGVKAPQDAVRIEEMLNYFSFPRPKNEAPIQSFGSKMQLTSCPWNINNELLFINLQAPSLLLDQIPPTNLIFLIDVSGSMDDQAKLPLLKTAFKFLVNNLRAQDTVAIVTYGGSVGIWLQPTSGAQKQVLNDAIERLEADGETPGEAAIRMAYGLAEKAFNPNANNRVILATDGDFNVGETSERELEELISEHRKSGIFLTCIGVGMGNYKDSKLETLAKTGNGNFAYIDNVHEAEKVLVKEFTKTLYAVATDCFVDVSFNPQMVKQYRLIGFDNRIEAVHDTSSVLEGGEIGTGHSLMAVFELVPTDKNVDAVNGQNKDDEIAIVKLRYKLPGITDEQLQNFAVKNDYGELVNADSTARLSTALIMFGELLKQSQFAKGYSWDDVTQLARTAINPGDFSQAEFLSLIDKAKKIYVEDEKKKKKDAKP